MPIPTLCSPTKEVTQLAFQSLHAEGYEAAPRTEYLRHVDLATINLAERTTRGVSIVKPNALRHGSLPALSSVAYMAGNNEPELDMKEEEHNAEVHRQRP